MAAEIPERKQALARPEAGTGSEKQNFLISPKNLPGLDLKA